MPSDAVYVALGNSVRFSQLLHTLAGRQDAHLQNHLSFTVAAKARMGSLEPLGPKWPMSRLPKVPMLIAESFCKTSVQLSSIFPFLNTCCVEGIRGKLDAKCPRRGGEEM